MQLGYLRRLAEPEHACIRTIRFVLAGGGQIRVREKRCRVG